MQKKFFSLIIPLLLIFSFCFNSNIVLISYATSEASQPNQYQVVSPIPAGSSIESILQPARLDTLQNKRIALVGGSFSASVTHAVIAELLEEQYNCTVFYMDDEIGKSGTFNPNNPSDKSSEFQEKLKTYNIDAVISGNCGCGICTVKETGNGLAAEYAGIPAVVVGAEAFIPQIESTGFNRGVPVVRTATYPGAFASDTVIEQQKKAKENLFPQIVDALTTTISQEEIDRIAGEISQAKYDDIVFTGSFERVQQFYKTSEMTDGLTVIPPTKERIEYYLTFTTYEAEDIVNSKQNGEIMDVPPANRKIYAYHVAANAIMAGCPAEYMPLCIAIVKCFANGNFYKSLASTHGWTPYVLVSGPIAKQLGISCDEGMINEYANKVLGRFVSLAMLNLAGYKIKENRMGTFGYMQPFVFAEDEAACQSIGWEPYHVEQNYTLEDNVITCGSTLTWGNPVNIGTGDPEKALQLLAWDATEKQQNGLGNTNPREARMILLTKDAAATLSKASGCNTKSGLIEALVNTARRPLWMRTYAHYWANTGSNIHLNKTFEEHYNDLKNGYFTENIEADIVSSTSAPEWMKNVIQAELIDTTQTIDPDNTSIVITGGDSANTFQILPGGDCCSSKIRLPRNWDTLIANKKLPANTSATANTSGLPDDYELQFAQDGTTYQSLGILEDQYDLIEPQNDLYPIISPTSDSDTHSYLKGSYDYIESQLKSRGMTDGLPIVPPTKIKAEKFIGYSAYNFDDVVATLNGKTIKTYQIAANAIMAGCLPEHLPVCIAFIEALSEESYFNSIKSGYTTPLMYVNGPLARQIGIDNSQGMTTEETNICIARFMELALINLAGINRTNAFGNIQPLVFSEDEEACAQIGWTPHHVESGFGVNESVITAASFSMWGNNVTPATDIPEEIMKVLAWDITEKNMGGLGGLSTKENFDAQRVIIITKPVAEALSEKYKTKEALEKALINNARRPLEMRAYAYYYTNGLDSEKTFSDLCNELKETSQEDVKETNSPPWMSGITYPVIETVATMAKGKTKIIVSGDSSRNKMQVVPGGISVSKPIKVSSCWDSLVTSMNYHPLSNYYLNIEDSTIRLPENLPAELTNGIYRILNPSVGETYLTQEGRVYFDSSNSTFHYYAYEASEKSSIVLDSKEDAAFISYLSLLEANSSFAVENRKITDIVIRFSTNELALNSNLLAFTAASFDGINLTIHANSLPNSNKAGGEAKNGAQIEISDSITSFAIDLDGDLVLLNATNAEFVKLAENHVTVDPTQQVGATSIIGSLNQDGTYRTMTFVNEGDGSYSITYHVSKQNDFAKIVSCYEKDGTINIILSGDHEENIALAGYNDVNKMIAIYLAKSNDYTLAIPVKETVSDLSWRLFFIDKDSFVPKYVPYDLSL